MSQRQKQVSKYRKRYARSIRQKKYNGQRWVLRNVPDHKIYNRTAVTRAVTDHD